MEGKDNTNVDKNNKYDRQLRLWGDHGQAALEIARVCLINATATGTEILKNLILPGIGSFTVVDGHKVLGEDAGNNFFLTKDSIGKSRAKVATDLLAELNEDVNGDFLEEDAEKLLDSNPDFFSQFSIVVATNLCERAISKLSNHLWSKNVPLLVCRCYGFIGYMRLLIKEHTVVESHPDNTHEDLRLDRPFPALVQYCDSLHLETMNSKDHSHTPWLVILFKYLQEWKKQHNGEVPKDYKERNLLKEMLKKGMHRNEEGILENEENFEEAIRSINTALVPSKSSAFWIMARALKDFVENEGEGSLPVRGTIPDMTADSERYIQLQQVYRKKAGEDATKVSQRVQKLLQSIGKVGLISEHEIKTFCRNAAFVRVVRCRSLVEEYDSKSIKLQELIPHLDDEEQDDAVFYVLLRAVDRFYEEYNAYPGWYNDQVETDVSKLKACLTKLLQDWGLSLKIKDDYIHEICRSGAAELHTVSAFIGGVAAQEIIKVITRQFVPFNNTYIYNAMKQTSITLEL
ncbi:hypothetical protein CHS0354_022737 [Potamilus streckersoni]|uniref:NEDD8-activating enzyme E1 regulatory subunit n=1 Tax=Potamilus streckersoni TaxID=2493646 RepID=A0AAE0VJK4_9BIVA|nr:hypothetical protein CHS0354_022737 [Potamilus streckersoni]